MLPSLPDALSRLRQHLTQLAPLSDEDWQLLVPHLRLVTLSKHGVFAEQGRVADEVAFVLEGLFRQYYTKADEERTIKQRDDLSKPALGQGIIDRATIRRFINHLAKRRRHFVRVRTHMTFVEPAEP